MSIYVAKIIKRTEIVKPVYNEIYNREIETHFLFDETEDYTCHGTFNGAEESLKSMMEVHFEVEWNKDTFNPMYGSDSKYHSSFEYPKNGNRIDYFAIIEEAEFS